MNTRGQLSIGQLFTVGLTIGVAIVGISIVAEVISQLQGTQTTDSAAYNISGSGLVGISKFNNWWGVIITVAVAVIVIGLLMFFRGRE